MKLLDEEIKNININDGNSVMKLQNILSNFDEYKINNYDNVLNFLYKVEEKYKSYFIITTLIAEILNSSKNEDYIKKSIEYYKKTLDLIEKEYKKDDLNIILWECNCYAKIASYYFNSKKYDNVINNHNKIINMLEEIDNDKKNDYINNCIANSYLTIANAYYNNSMNSDNMDSKKIIGYYETTVKYFEKIKEKNIEILKNVALSYYQIANINLKTNLKKLMETNFNIDTADFEVSINYFTACINILNEILNKNDIDKDNLLKIYFRMSESHFYLGYIFYICNIHNYTGKCYTIAIQYYEESLKLAKNFDEKITIINQLGIVYSYFGLYNKSIDIYKYAKTMLGDISNININPKLYISIYLNLSNSYFKNKNYDKAIEILEYIYNNSQYGKEDEAVTISLSLGYSITKEYNKAIEILKKALEIGHKHYDIYHNLGRCYIEKGNIEKNNSFYEESIKYISNSSRYQSKSYLAYAYLKLGNKDEANKILDEIIKSNLSYDVFIIFYRMYREELLSFDESKHYMEIILKKNIEFYKNNINIDLYNNTLYQYIPWYTCEMFKSVISMISNEEIELRNPHSFNDPIDPPTKLLDENDILYEMTNNFQISCLTTNPYNILMWAHYANKHEGICIEYDMSKLFDIEENYILRKVEYNTNLTFDYNIELDNLFNTRNDLQYYSTDSKYPIDIFFMKHKDWLYEDEYKLIYYEENIEKSKNKKIKFKLPIKHIYLGKNIKDIYQKSIEEIANKKNIPLSKMKCKEDNLFELEDDLNFKSEFIK